MVVGREDGWRRGKGKEGWLLEYNDEATSADLVFKEEKGGANGPVAGAMMQCLRMRKREATGRSTLK